MSYSTILFDLDHTLLDSDASEVAAFSATMRVAGATNPGRYFEIYDKLNRELWKAAERGEISADEIRVERFRRLLQQTDLLADPEELGDTFALGLAQFGDLYPGTREVLAELTERCSLALVTNGISAIQRARVDRLDLGEFFDAVIISTEIGFAKPQAGFFDATFGQLNGASLPDTLMVGDNLDSDIVGAHAYGLETCWFNPKGRGGGSQDVVTHEICHLSQVLTLV